MISVIGIDNYTFLSPPIFWVVGVSIFLLFALVILRYSRWYLALLRIAAISLLVFALSSPYLEQSSSEKEQQALVDVSKSIPDEALNEFSKILIDYSKKSVAKIKVFPFAEKVSDAVLIIDPAANLGTQQEELVGQLKDARSKINSVETDIASSLRSAFLRSANASFLFASDGQETKNNAREAAEKLSEQGLRIYPLQIEDRFFSAKTETISGLFLPLTAFSAEQVEIGVSVRNPGNKKITSPLEVTVDGVPILASNISVPSKEERIISLQTPSLRGGLHKVTAKLKTENGMVTEERWVSVKERDRILLLSGTKQEAKILEEIIRSKGYNIDSIIPSPSEEIPEMQGQFSRIILNNISYKQLGESFVGKLKGHVESGGGLLIAGGDRSFGLGGYLDTPLDEISPLKSIPPQTEKKRISTAVMLIIDKSGSMSRQGKMQAAQLAALTSIRGMKDDDFIGIIGFDAVPMVILDLAPAGVVKPYAAERLANLIPQGKTNLLPALQAARQKLTQSKASRKHIIVLSDGDLPGENDRLYLNELDAMGAYNITLSAVAIGVEADVPFMRLLAERGKGLFHHTLDPSRLPQIFLQDIYVATGEKTMQEQSDFSVGTGPHGITSSLVNRFPSLRGFVETLPKKAASIELITRKGDDVHPIMASWTLGKGKVISFSSDAIGRWSSSWLRWEEFSDFWSDLIKSIKNEEQENKKAVDFDLRYSIQGRSISLDLVVFDETTGSLSANVQTPLGDSRVVMLKQEKPGRFKGVISDAVSGNYGIDITHGSQIFPPLKITVQPESLGEVVGRGVSYDLLNELARITQGVVNPEATQVTASVKHSSEKEWFVWPLVALAVLFLIAEIWLREKLI